MLAPPRSRVRSAAAALRALARDARRGWSLIGGPLARHRLAALAVVAACVLSAVVTSVAVDERSTTTASALVTSAGAPSLGPLRRRVLQSVEQPAGTNAFIGLDRARGRLVVVVTGPDAARTRRLARAVAVRLVETQLGVDKRTLARRAATAERAAAALPTGSRAAAHLRRQARELRSGLRSFDRLWVVGPTVQTSGSDLLHDGLVALVVGLGLATAVAVGLDGLSRGAPRL
jgi:hypothetical protein